MISGTQDADFSVLTVPLSWTGAGEDDGLDSLSVVEDLTNDGVTELLVGSPGGGRSTCLTGVPLVLQRMLFGLGRFLPLVVQTSEECSQGSVISMVMGPLSLGDGYV